MTARKVSCNQFCKSSFLSSLHSCNLPLVFTTYQTSDPWTFTESSKPLFRQRINHSEWGSSFSARKNRQNRKLVQFNCRVFNWRSMVFRWHQVDLCVLLVSFLLRKFIKPNQSSARHLRLWIVTDHLIVSAMGTWMLNIISFLALVGRFVKSELLKTTYLHYENPTGNIYFHYQKKDYWYILEIST